VLGRRTTALALAVVVATAALPAALPAAAEPPADPSGARVVQVPWTLDQKFVKPTARSIRIQITGGVCGVEPDRFDHADVRVTRSKIRISAFLHQSPPRGDVCIALAVLIPARVALPARVRDRSIFDTADGQRRWPRRD
jgi:hypothetical protein